MKLLIFILLLDIILGQGCDQEVEDQLAGDLDLACINGGPPASTFCGTLPGGPLCNCDQIVTELNFQSSEKVTDYKCCYKYQSVDTGNSDCDMMKMPDISHVGFYYDPCASCVAAGSVQSPGGALLDLQIDPTTCAYGVKIDQGCEEQNGVCDYEFCIVYDEIIPGILIGDSCPVSKGWYNIKAGQSSTFCQTDVPDCPFDCTNPTTTTPAPTPLGTQPECGGFPCATKVTAGEMTCIDVWLLPLATSLRVNNAELNSCSFGFNGMLPNEHESCEYDFTIIINGTDEVGKYERARVCFIPLQDGFSQLHQYIPCGASGGTIDCIGEQVTVFVVDDYNEDDIISVTGCGDVVEFLDPVTGEPLTDGNDNDFELNNPPAGGVGVVCRPNGQLFGVSCTNGLP